MSAIASGGWNMSAIASGDCFGASPALGAVVALASVACFAYAIDAMRAQADAIGTPRYAASASHACRITDAGGVRCRGTNDHGELGDGTRRGKLVEVDVVAVRSGAVALAAGPRYTCAWLRDGRQQCWGDAATLARLALPTGAGSQF